jgi:hypothetical protein
MNRVWIELLVMHLQIDGYLLGPILEEFKQKKFQLIQSSHELISD